MINKASQKVSFHYIVDQFHFPARTVLKEFIQDMMRKEKVRIDHINYIFCDDEYLLQINRQHLNHDNYTDIITFELSPKGEPVLSDIYISIERVKENAGLFKTGFLNELHRVIFHGALHLCGYKDKTSADKTLMRSKEDRLLERYFVSRGTGRV